MQTPITYSSSQQPLVFHWKDSKPTGAEGWIVCDRVINGVAGGGIFMHSEATVEETKDIAFNMTKKFTVTNPQIGGAKAGIRFNHKDPRARFVLKRFICENQLLLKNCWVTAGDLNTDDSFIEQVIQEEIGLPTCQALLGTRIAEKLKAPNLSNQLAQLIPTMCSPFFPLIEGAVGYGIAEAIKEAIKVNNPKHSDMKDTRVVIQGFGAVGSSLAYFLTVNKIATVVGICDIDGYVVCEEGLPVINFLQERSHKVAEMHKNGVNEEKIAYAKKNLLHSINAETVNQFEIHKFRTKGTEPAAFLSEFLAATKAEVISLCATRYQMTMSMAEHALNSTWKDVNYRYFICGANNPFGVVDATTAMLDNDRIGVVQEYLTQNQVCVIPDWVANSGTAQLFHRGLSADFSQYGANMADKVLQACAEPIGLYIQKAFKLVNQNPFLIARGCQELALELMNKPVFLEAAKPFPLNPANSRYALPPPQNPLPLETRFDLVKSIGEEIIKEEELKVLLEKSQNPVAYDGFEPSGRMHIAQGIMKMINVNKLTKAGFTFIFWVADWFALMNHKMGGDLAKIQTVGKYFIEVWKACGMDMDRVRFLWASEEINKYNDVYWDYVLDIATKFNVKRIVRCGQIMGRDKEYELSSSQIFYPCMQCADIFFLGVDVCQLGVDQRKVNMLGREYADLKKITPPVVVSHHMLAGLKKGQAKMSKSDSNSAIFMEDSEAEVAEKIKGAHCPEKNVAENPCMEYMKHIVFESFETVSIHCKQSNETKQFKSYKELCDAYEQGVVHPTDLKPALVEYLNKLLQPVRDHFKNNEQAKQLLEKVKEYRNSSK